VARRPGPRPPRPRVSAEDEALFIEAAAGVQPLAVADRVRLAPVKTAILPRRDPLPRIAAITVEGEDGLASGRAAGVNRAQGALLRQGKVRAEATVDLHGMTAAEAEPAFEQFLLESVRLRRRCVLVIHGQGRHTGGTSVLRDLVVSSLVGRASGLVHAFAPAPPSDGGRGATYVMLRSP
jgi:DNA-nicking Smr family endonuclease